MERISPREAGAAMAANWPPLTDEQVEQAARILATVVGEQAEGLAARRAGQESDTTA